MPLVDNPAAHATLLSREDSFRHLADKPWCDVLVVGGGIHGATFAQLAALHGMRTVLLERGDFAQGTSSRSSRLAHGGIRYLEHFDFRQVFEGIRERENLLRVAPHLVRSQEFQALTLENDSLLRMQMRLGLSLYALMALGRAGLPKQRAVPPGMSTAFGPGFLYRDGILSDTRLVLERVLAARQEGAHCLNYTESLLFLHNPTGVDVRFVDRVSGTQGSIQAGIVVNTAGPWISTAGGMKTRELEPLLRFSRGSHVLYSKPWQGPALVLPIRDGRTRVKGRYYFVTPHPGGTLVGTTEREVDALELDPLPSPDEIEEIQSRVEVDLPGMGLSRESAFYCFAGYRALPAASPAGESEVDALSRRHRWIFRKGVLSLVGGKYTTAAWACEEGFRLLLKVSGADVHRASLRSRLLPGAADLSNRVTAFSHACRDAGVPEQVKVQTIARLGSRVSSLLNYTEGLKVLGDCVLKGELQLALDVEQALSLEDVMRRRVELELKPGHGIGTLSQAGEVTTELCEMIPRLEFTGAPEAQRARYVERMSIIEQLLRPSSEVGASVRNK